MTDYIAYSHAPLYEVRLPVTPETAVWLGGSIDMVGNAENYVRVMMLDQSGPELAARAKLWWELESFRRDLNNPDQRVRRWQTWQRGELFPPHVKMLYCVMQVVQWYERNPLIYGFQNRAHDWPDFRCDECGFMHTPPTHYCPVCGDVFGRGDVGCGHTLEEDGPPAVSVLRIPEARR